MSNIALFMLYLMLLIPIKSFPNGENFHLEYYSNNYLSNYLGFSIDFPFHPVVEVFETESSFVVDTFSNFHQIFRLLGLKNFRMKYVFSKCENSVVMDLDLSDYNEKSGIPMRVRREYRRIEDYPYYFCFLEELNVTSFYGMSGCLRLHEYYQNEEILKGSDVGDIIIDVSILQKRFLGYDVFSFEFGEEESEGCGVHENVDDCTSDDECTFCTNLGFCIEKSFQVTCTFCDECGVVKESSDEYQLKRMCDDSRECSWCENEGICATDCGMYGEKKEYYVDNYAFETKYLHYFVISILALLLLACIGICSCLLLCFSRCMCKRLFDVFRKNKKGFSVKEEYIEESKY